MTCLGFSERAEKAVNFYVSVFKDARILSMNRFGDTGPGAKGSMMTALFEINGHRFLALNGGPPFTFTIGMSLIVHCDSQQEIDEYWEKLSIRVRSNRSRTSQARTS